MFHGFSRGNRAMSGHGIRKGGASPRFSRFSTMQTSFSIEPSIPRVEPARLRGSFTVDFDLG